MGAQPWAAIPKCNLLANRGYAVLQMKGFPMTEQGYSRELLDQELQTMGQDHADDITDGVEFLVKSGQVDPKRVAIYGASYGGYATLAGITCTPDLYACAVDYVGVSDLFTFQRSFPPYWAPYKEMMYEMVGDREGQPVAGRGITGPRHADEVRHHSSSPKARTTPGW